MKANQSTSGEGRPADGDCDSLERSNLRLERAGNDRVYCVLNCVPAGRSAARYTAKTWTIPHSCIVIGSHAITDYRKEIHK